MAKRLHLKRARNRAKSPARTVSVVGVATHEGGRDEEPIADGSLLPLPAWVFALWLAYVLIVGGLVYHFIPMVLR